MFLDHVHPQKDYQADILKQQQIVSVILSGYYLVEIGFAQRKVGFLFFLETGILLGIFSDKGVTLSLHFPAENLCKKRICFKQKLSKIIN